MSDESHVHSLGHFFSLSFGSTKIETFAETVDLKVSIEEFANLRAKGSTAETIDIEVQGTVGENDDTGPVGEKNVGGGPMHDTRRQRGETEETRMNDQNEIHPRCPRPIVNHQTIVGIFTLEGRTITRTGTQRGTIRSDGQARLNDVNDDANVEENDQDRRNYFREDRAESGVIPAESHLEKKRSPKDRSRVLQGTNRLIRRVNGNIVILLRCTSFFALR